MHPIQVIAHRGASAHEPENTLSAIRRAVDDGADMIEIDVRFVDGGIFVFHDDTLERCTSGSGPVYSKSFQELRRLDAGKGEKIPILAEVIAEIGGRVPLNIEFKDAASVRPVCDLIQPLPPERTLLSSFDWENLRDSRQLLPDAQIAILTEHATFATLEEAETLKAVSVNIDVEKLSAEFVKMAHEKALLVYAFTVRTEEELERASLAQVDGIFADDPAWAIKICNVEGRIA